MPCILCNEFHVAYGMFLRTHVRTRRCIANSLDIRSHHYCCDGYHLGCMPWYCDPWTFADTAGLVPWIGHHGLLIGVVWRRGTVAYPLFYIIPSTGDRLHCRGHESHLLPFGELFVAMNFVVWTFGGFDGQWMHRQGWNICHGMERHGFWG